MVYALGYLVDTNILLRLSRRDDPQHQLVKQALHTLNGNSVDLYFTLQNIAEFWNFCTRPLDRNGFGLSIGEVRQCVEPIERTMTLLPDNVQVYSAWRRLIVDYNVHGVQVHDARLAAIMQVYGVPHILTFNQADFMRYTHLQAIHPSHVTR